MVQACNPQPSGLQRDLFPLSHQFRMLAPSLGLLRMKTSLLFLPHPSSLLGHTAELAKGEKTIKQETLVWEWGRWLRGQESACRDTGDRVPSPGREDAPQEGTAAHCSVLAWRVPWTQEPGGLQSVGSRGIEHCLGLNSISRIAALLIPIVSNSPCRTFSQGVCETRRLTRLDRGLAETAAPLHPMP